MKLPAFLRLSLTLSILGTVLVALTYVAVQQSYRQAANDPQIQLAEDGAAALSHGATPFQIVGNAHVEISTSLAPFVTVFDAGQIPLATNGQFEGETLVPPPGTFEYAKAHGQNRFTWAPRAGTREAAVLVYNAGAHPGYALAARSLYEIEARESNLTTMAGAALGVIIATSVFLLLIVK